MLFHLALAALRSRQRRLLAAALLATSPAWLWMSFSLVYYGFPFPNTYHAKAANSGAPFIDRIELGVSYVRASLRADLPSLLYLAAAAAYAAYRRELRVLLPLAKPARRAPAQRSARHGDARRLARRRGAPVRGCDVGERTVCLLGTELLQDPSVDPHQAHPEAELTCMGGREDVERRDELLRQSQTP